MSQPPGSPPIVATQAPTELESAETYERMGFTRQAAEEMWVGWSSTTEDHKKNYPRRDFLSWALDKIESSGENPETGAADWAGYMTRIGIADELQRAILKPGFDDVRCTASCNFWLLETVKERYWDLKRRHDARRC
jgi:hypothetical protein